MSRNRSTRGDGWVTCGPVCSKKYRLLSQVEKNVLKNKDNKKCIDCGKFVSHKSYTRCQSCSLLEKSRQRMLKKIRKV